MPPKGVGFSDPLSGTLKLRNCRLRRSDRSILLLHLNDRPAMGALADLLVLIVRFHPEAKLAAVDLQEFGSDRDLLTLGRGAEVLDVDLEADSRVPLGEVALHGLDTRAFHQADHRWC